LQGGMCGCADVWIREKYKSKARAIPSSGRVGRGFSAMLIWAL
jgi:hypothetical protein